MTGYVSNRNQHLLATAKAIHRAVDFLETKNVEAFYKAMAIAVCEPGKFEKDEQYSGTFEAREAYANVLAEIEDLKKTALALVNSATASGREAVAAKLDISARAALRVSYAPIADAGALARRAADLAIDAASIIADLSD